MKCFPLTSVLFLSLMISCSSKQKVRDCRDTKSPECEVVNYERLLSSLSNAEAQLRAGNSFQALRDLDEIGESGQYHGKCQSLFRLALESSLQSTNNLSTIPTACTRVRERVSFLRRVSPDRLVDLKAAITGCGIDISQNINSFDLNAAASQIDLSQKEALDGNVYEEAVKIQQKYNSNPWEELLLIDLKALSQFEIVLGKPQLQKDSPSGYMRFKVPLELKHKGNLSYCSQYKGTLHDEELSHIIPCYDYPSITDHISGFWRFDRKKWTENSYVTPIKVSASRKQLIQDVPFIKNYKNVLALDLQYGTNEVVTEQLSVSYPGELVHNLMARLAYMKLGGKDLRPHAPEVYVEARSQRGVRFQIVKSQTGLFNFNDGYIMDLVLPLEKGRDLETFKLYVPIQEILHFYHELSRTQVPISGKIYGE